MKIPKRIQPLIEHGMVDEVLSRLMSGKEAHVFVVRCGDETRCAKVYKEADKRSFKKAVTYQEGRKHRNSRRARAMEKGSRYGREQQEATWQTAEVDALARLAAAGVRVPQTFGYLDGVLLMELIQDADGDAAPRLADVSMTEEQALANHAVVMQHIVRMLCAGVVHGDLSEFNVLVDPQGPVIIDLPQAVDAAGNNNAEAMLARDINNMTRYYGQFAPQLKATRYDKEIWALFESGDLHPEVVLTGRFRDATELADVEAVLEEIETVREEAMERQRWLKESAEDND